MNNYYLIGAMVVVVLLGGAGVWWLTRPAPTTAPIDTNNPVPINLPTNVSVPNSNATPQDTAAESQVNTAYLGGAGTAGGVKIMDTAVSGDYALVVWADDVAGGEALLKRDTVSGRWYTVTTIGGAFGVAELRKEGVPQRTILSLRGQLDNL